MHLHPVDLVLSPSPSTPVVPSSSVLPGPKSQPLRGRGAITGGPLLCQLVHKGPSVTAHPGRAPPLPARYQQVQRKSSARRHPAGGVPAPSSAAFMPWVTPAIPWPEAQILVQLLPASQLAPAFSMLGMASFCLSATLTHLRCLRSFSLSSPLSSPAAWQGSIEARVLRRLKRVLWRKLLLTLAAGRLLRAFALVGSIRRGSSIGLWQKASGLARSCRTSLLCSVASHWYTTVTCQCCCCRTHFVQRLHFSHMLFTMLQCQGTKLVYRQGLSTSCACTVLSLWLCRNASPRRPSTPHNMQYSTASTHSHQLILVSNAWTAPALSAIRLRGLPLGQKGVAQRQTQPHAKRVASVLHCHWAASSSCCSSFSPLLQCKQAIFGQHLDNFWKCAQPSKGQLRQLLPWRQYSASPPDDISRARLSPWRGSRAHATSTCCKAATVAWSPASMSTPGATSACGAARESAFRLSRHEPPAPAEDS